MAKALAVRAQLLDYMTQILQKRGSKINQEKADNVTELLLKCLVEGLPLNMAKKAESSGL